MTENPQNLPMIIRTDTEKLGGKRLHIGFIDKPDSIDTKAMHEKPCEQQKPEIFDYLGDGINYCSLQRICLYYQSLDASACPVINENYKPN